MTRDHHETAVNSHAILPALVYGDFEISERNSNPGDY
jgi:hypothetical protein